MLRIEKCLPDMGYRPGLVAAVKPKVGGATISPFWTCKATAHCEPVRSRPILSGPRLYA